MLPTEVGLLVRDLSAQRPLDEGVPKCLIDSFEANRELLAVHHVAAVVDSSRKLNLLRWADLRQYALRTRTAETKAAFDKISDVYDLSIERALCFAMDYFSQIIWLKDHPQRTVLSPFCHWDDAFDTLQAVTKLETSSLTLWIIFIAATVEVMLLRRDHQTSLFARAFTMSVNRLKFRACEETRHALLAFLYQEKIFDPYLELLMGPMRQVDESLRLNLIQLGAFESKPENVLPREDVSKQMLTGHVPFELRQEQLSFTVPLENC
jgi:hypothetical protein